MWVGFREWVGVGRFGEWVGVGRVQGMCGCG